MILIGQFDSPFVRRVAVDDTLLAMGRAIPDAMQAHADASQALKKAFGYLDPRSGRA